MQCYILTKGEEYIMSLMLELAVTVKKGTVTPLCIDPSKSGKIIIGTYWWKQLVVVAN